MTSLGSINSFGEIAAEDDAVLDYFLKTDAVEKIESGRVLLVLGRKGSGKTALVKHFTQVAPDEHGKPLSLRNYPWNTHGDLIDRGASETEAYVASWRLLIAIRIASTVVRLGAGKLSTDHFRGLSKFLDDNFGTDDPEARVIFAKGRLKVTGLSLTPTIAGVTLGSINFGDKSGSNILGLELYQLANSLLKSSSIVVAELGIKRLFLHFDELDQGLNTIDLKRKAMIVGLVLASREISNSNDLHANVSPIVYLRSDIWDQIEFSDKNKISRSSTVRLLWNDLNLKELVNSRLKKLLSEDTDWDRLDDGAKMRGSQEKWQHIVSRTFLRPRDIIQYLNEALAVAIKRDPKAEFFKNEDINGCRDAYSDYLREELNDEISPHWPEWSEALKACARNRTITFTKENFITNYKSIRTPENQLDAEKALEQLYRFSVIGYQRPSSGGGSTWSFRYIDEISGWDNTATRLKVHLGLKEHAKLKEVRERRVD